MSKQRSATYRISCADLGGGEDPAAGALITMENVRNVKIPQGGSATRLAQVLLMGGAAVYGVANSIFNVEGGHR